MSAPLDDTARRELYDAIVGKLPDWIQPAQRQTVALDLIDELAPLMNGRLGIGGNMPPPDEAIEGETEEDQLKRIDPKRLLVLPVEKLPKLFDVQFPEISARFDELAGLTDKWKDDHRTDKGGLIAIADDDENNDLSDLMRQIRDFAGDDGEVHTARKACKRMVFDAIKALDTWFNDWCDPLMAVHGPTKNAPLGSMQERQTTYLTAKAQAERAERDRMAREAELEARRLADEARLAADQERARIAALTEKGVDAETAADIAATDTDRAAEEADTAAVTSSLIGQAAAAPDRDLVRTRSAMGSTTTLAGTWDVDEANVDMKALCTAVAKGDAPVTFVTIVPQAIRQAIRAKINPLRACPGLVIRETFAARRSGSR